MLAAVATHPSPEAPLDALEVGEHPEPDPSEGWTVVTVRAAAVNHHDVFTLRGVATPAENLPIVLGSDCAGTTDDGREVVVHAVIGEGDATPAESGSIFSEIHDGTQAERVAVPEANLVEKPEGLSFAEAACLPTAWLTAYRMLFVQGGMRPGQTVLVQGAGGGLATALQLLGTGAGLRVYVTSRSEEKLARAEELGARGIPSGDRLPERVDAVMESVGEATWGHSLRSVKAGGTIVVAGATSGPNPPAELQRVFFRQVRIIGSTMGTKGELADLVRMLDVTGVRPLVDDEIALADARSAYERMVEGELFGKLVLVP